LREAVLRHTVGFAVAGCRGAGGFAAHFFNDSAVGRTDTRGVWDEEDEKDRVGPPDIEAKTAWNGCAVLMAVVLRA